MHMDLKELTTTHRAELSEKMQQLTQELFNFRFQLGTGRLENPMQDSKDEAVHCQDKNRST